MTQAPPETRIRSVSNDGRRGYTLVPAKRRTGIVREFWYFLLNNKKWWMVPIVVVILLLMALAILSATGAIPAMYAVF